MTNETLSILQKREAIERGLTGYLNHRHIEQALQHWESKYGNLPSFVLNRFIHEICDTEELKTHRKDILKTVLNEMSKVEKQIKSHSVEQVIEQDLIENIELKTNLSNAFFYFVRAVVENIPAPDRYDFSSDVKQQLSSKGLRVRADRNLQDFEFLDVITALNYPALITVLYENYCIYYGPAKADSLYARLKNEVKNEFPQVDLHQLI